MEKNKTQPKKKKVVKIEGTDIKKCHETYLSSKLGTYKAAVTVARIVGFAFLLFFMIFGATYDLKSMFMFGGLGLIFPVLFCGLSWPLVPKIKAIQAELDRRAGKKPELKEELDAISKHSGNRYKLIAILAVPVGILLAIIFVICLNGNKDDSGKCTICGEAATTDFQGSEYCESHYVDAVKWTIDEVVEEDE